MMGSPPPPPLGSGSDDAATRPTSDALRLRIGTTIAERYRVISLLGEGGMGVVYLVEHVTIRKRMALKVLNRDLMQDSAMVARFEREALATAHLEHPNIVAATDLGHTEDGALFLALEYIDGKSLRDELLSGPLEPMRVLHIARQIASALVRAHSVDLVHRDLKPENIMLLKREEDRDFVKVLDFGIAKVRIGALALTESGSINADALTRHGTIFGTPTYMAPEQAVGGEVDGRTDLYSLGVMLYELLTGVPPFPGDDSSQLLKQHVIGKVPTFAEQAPALKLPAGLEPLIMRLLEKRPDKRPRDAREVIASIDEIAAAEGLRFESSQSVRGLATPTPAPMPVPPTLAQVQPPSTTSAGGATANPATPAPSPSPPSGTRALVKAQEAARWSRSVVWPALQRICAHAWTLARTHGAKGWSRGLEVVRSRLPAERRGMAPLILGVIVAAVLALPVALLLLLSSSPSDGQPPKHSRPTVAALTGYASDREMERGVEKGVTALEALVAKYPQDARCHRALVRARAATKDYVGALRALVPLLQLDPSAQSDEAMGQIVAEAALIPETADSAIAFLESAMGEQGVDLLLELAGKTSTEPGRTKFNQSLAKDAVRKLASPEALLLLDLRAAARCDQKKALLPRATQHGGTRVQKYLQELKVTTGCGPTRQSDCWSCLRKGSALQNAISAIAQRGGAPG